MLWSFDLPWLRAEAQRDTAWCRRLLPRVSRTFALSIAMLPPSLRDAIGDAYLLCRIVDSIEDDPRLSLEARTRLFDVFDAALGDDASDEMKLESAARNANVGETAAERELCSHAGAVLRAFRALERAQRDAIRPKVLEMSRGMREYSTRTHAEG
ncbi:MAG TPA: squalene/phytoene synthase family protein, partial [Polyangiaceae bacterium]|nr:squalene/phytoene synthase family protein [Polyangiaceae bacterium]